MKQNHIATISSELELESRQIAAAASLLGEGATIPFIARYRKERTGSLDEVAITAIRDRLEQLRKLDDRRNSILSSLEERDLLTDSFREDIENAVSMTALEDLYMPFKPKRRTRATIAREKGLEPLAEWLLEQMAGDPQRKAAEFIDPDKGVETVLDALDGARDIIAEKVSENAGARERMRKLFLRKGEFHSRVIPGREEQAQKYRDYFDLLEPVSKAPSHRILAMRRGEKERQLTLKIAPPDEDALAILEKLFLNGFGASRDEVQTALKDGYKRLLAPSIETEIRLVTKERADKEAIEVFSANLRQLLLSPPLGRRRVMALDPGFRTGCKTVCLDKQGMLMDNTAVYPFGPASATEKAAATILELCSRYDIEFIAVGNGTAGRETEAFLRKLDLSDSIGIIMVNESGASVYSASEIARKEFPDRDLTVRGAVSIGRRLMDPLAELVKIDPKSIGVGQYQHDVDQKMLRRSLNDVVESCVNNVGVDVNTASPQLLAYVSGIGPSLASSIVSYREMNGPFRTRTELLKVPGLGRVAFQQAAGFLRIHEGDDPLDSSAVHPESYSIVERMAADLRTGIPDLMKDAELRKLIDLKGYTTDTVGIPTLQDIMVELERPGRDPRKDFELFEFADVHDINDLLEGMVLPGIVTNVTAFGAFVDIGIHSDGLVHISRLADRFVKYPGEIVSVGDRVSVKVLDVDAARKRISLSMRGQD